MPPITYEDVARDSATRVMEKFRERSAESRSLTMRASGELYEIIRAEVLSTLEQFGRAAAMGAKNEGPALAEAPTLERIAAGDVVRLRSGGPLMTVGDAPKPMLVPGTGGPVVACFWHDDEQHAASGLFLAATLERVSSALPELIEAARNLWGPVGVLDASDNKWDHPFDYYQSADGTARIRALGKALRHIDGKARSFEPREKG